MESKQRLTKDDIAAFLAELDSMPSTTAGRDRALTQAAHPTTQLEAQRSRRESTSSVKSDESITSLSSQLSTPSDKLISAKPTKHVPSPGQSPTEHVTDSSPTASRNTAPVHTTGTAQSASKDGSSSSSRWRERLGTQMTQKMRDMMIKQENSSSTSSSPPLAKKLFPATINDPSREVSSSAPELGSSGINGRDSMSLQRARSLQRADSLLNWASKTGQKLLKTPKSDRVEDLFAANEQVPLIVEDIKDEFIAGNIFLKRVRTDWKSYYCVVDHEFLLVFKAPKDKKAWKISISQAKIASVDQIDEKPFCLSVEINGSDQLIIACESARDREVWLKAFNLGAGLGAKRISTTGPRTSSVITKGPIKVYGETLRREDTSKGMLIDMEMTTLDVIKLALQKYQIDEDPDKYGLFERDADGVESLLSDSALPLTIQNSWLAERVKGRGFVLKLRVPDDSNKLRPEDGLRLTNDEELESIPLETGEVKDSHVRSTLRNSIFGVQPAHPQPDEQSSGEVIVTGMVSEYDKEHAEQPVLGEIAQTAPTNSTSLNMVRMSIFGMPPSQQLELQHDSNPTNPGLLSASSAFDKRKAVAYGGAT